MNYCIFFLNVTIIQCLILLYVCPPVQEMMSVLGVLFMEAQIGFSGRGRCGTYQHCLAVKPWKSHNDEPTEIEVEIGQAPKLFVSVEDGTVKSLSLVADGLTMQLEHCDIGRACVTLLASYYVFNIEYPKPYSQFLGFMQEAVLGLRYPGTKSAEYVDFKTELLRNSDLKDSELHENLRSTHVYYSA